MDSNPSIKHAADLMPMDPQSQAVLQARAQHYAAIKKHEATNISDINRYICFTLGSAEERYGLPYQYVIEIMNNTKITKLPNVPPHISGLINRHGVLIAILDLTQLFGIPVSDYTENANIIVVTAQNMTVGILTNTIIGSDIYDPAKLAPPLSIHDTLKPAFIMGLHNGVVAMIQVEALLSSSELHINE